MKLSYFFKKRQLFFLGIFIASLMTFFDLWSKRIIFEILDNYALQHHQNYPQIEIFSFFNIVKVFNRGVSFGMFNGIENSQIIFSILQGGIAIILVIWLYFKVVNREIVFSKQQIYFTISIALIIGGALGNAIDRVQNGAVADFLDFHLFGYHWPAFNLADSSVFIGVAMLLFEDLFFKNKIEKK